MKFQINELYEPLFTTSRRYVLITGGRGSLKSTTVHQFVILSCLQAKHGILFTRYTMTSAEKSIIPEFRIVLERMNLQKFFSFSKNRITCLRTGAFVLFSGVKSSSGLQTANLKSLAGITIFIVEEGEDFHNERAFDDIDRSVRSIELPNKVIWVQNPSTKEHFIYKRFFEHSFEYEYIEGFKYQKSTNEQVEHIHSTYHIASQYLSQDWLVVAEDVKIKNPDRYQQIYIGAWLEKAEGVVFNNWEEGEFDETLQYCYGLDFGYSKDPDALVKVALDKKRKVLYLHELMYKTGQSTTTLTTTVKNIVKEQDAVICDSASARTITDMRLGQINALACRKRKVVQMLKEMLEYKVIVTTTSKNLKVELNNYRWSDRRAGIVVDDYNHLIDAARYGFDFLNRGNVIIAQK